MSLRCSVIMPMDRPGEDARRAVASVLAQKGDRLTELLIVAGSEIDLPDDPRIRRIVVPARNPAVRRNRAVSEASGDLLAFIDDDAFAREDWLETAAAFLETNPEVLAVGGPDPSPDGAPITELVSDTLLSTRWIGSGVAAHENRRGVFDVSTPHALALVNLVVRHEAFVGAGGFDEGIGYIGEDTALIETLLERGRVVYHDGIVVFHRRRSFPSAYVRQRWRYRLKTGHLLVHGGSRYRTGKVLGFLGVGFALLSCLAVFPSSVPWILAAYCVLTIGLAAPRTHIPPIAWLVIPVAFAIHHATYFLGILTGVVKGLFSGSDR